MNELIKITENNGKKAVSARDLHYFLESKQDFTNWIKGRIYKYGLVENVDFVFELWDIRLNKIIEPINQLVTGSYRTEFILTMEAAKELSMVEGNEKGKQARQYFIAMEKVALNNTMLNLPNFNNPVAAARAWADAMEQKQLSDNKVLELQPKAEVYDKISDATNLLTMNDAAKTLKYGRNTLMKLLRDMLILRANNTPYQSYIDSGYFEVKIKPITNDSNYCQTFVTGKGLAWLSKKLTVLN